MGSTSFSGALVCTKTIDWRPIWITSPELSGVGTETGRPLSRVPLVLPRSFSTQLPVALRRVEPSGVRCEVPDGLRLQAIGLGAIPLGVGSASWRSVRWQRWPVEGPPPFFAGAAAYERQVNDMLDGEDDVADYVRRLEEDSDEEDEDDDDEEPFVIPTTESLAAEVERFLRDQSGGQS